MLTKLMPSISVAAVALLLAAAPALAEMHTYSVPLTGGAQVPPVETTGSGNLEATYDTESRVLTWTITYEGLTGPATAAHFHGPADEMSNAGPVVPIPDDQLASPIEGEATLDEQQAADLEAGLWYFNVHTQQYPDGELRGQLTRQGTM